MKEGAPRRILHGGALARQFHIRPARHGVMLIALFLASVAFAQSQSQTEPRPQSKEESLGEVARKARAKKGKTEPGKTYTEEDLSRLKPGNVSVLGQGTSTPSATSLGRGAPADSISGKPKEKVEKGEEYWKGRFAAARNKLARAEKELEVLQGELETGSMLSGRAVILTAESFLKLQQRIEAKKLEVQKYKQALVDLEDEFRHAGGEPGWIRP